MKICSITPLKIKENYFSIGWGITDLCNYRCSYCFPGNHQGKWKGLGKKKGLHYIRTLQTRLKDKKRLWTLAGGEPTLLPELPSLLEQMNRTGDLVLMTSNGSAPLHWWKENLKHFYTVELSYHHGKSELNHFLEVAHELENSKAIGHIHLMVTPQNFTEVYQMALRLKEESGLSLGFSSIYEQTNGRLNNSFYTPEQEKLRNEFCDNYNQHHKPRLVELGVVEATFKPPQGQILTQKLGTNDLEWKRLNQFKGWTCAAGLEGISIDLQGKIRPSRCEIPELTWDLEEFCHFYDRATPVICPHDYCACGPDLLFTKRKLSPCS